MDKKKKIAFYNPQKAEGKIPEPSKDYQPGKIEGKWQQLWIEKRIFSPDLDRAQKPYYNLMMFPYPSAEGLHVGNMYAFVGADIWGRFMRMRGYDVFEPIGLDGFGIHSENYAIKVGKHPVELSKQTEKRFYEQLKKTGNAYHWTRTLETYDPDYYKWTQWIFVQMFKHGLAYRKKARVNWCPSCKTVLADEQVIGGECERCGTQVEDKKLEQWFFKITDYAERLIKGIGKINWPKKIKIAQERWIGKSVGAEIVFKIDKSDLAIPVFTTRPDTLFGATFLAVSPQSDWADRLVTAENKNNVSKYIKDAQKYSKDNREREKSGVFTGLYALHPVTGEKIPVWIADYVAAEYGSGAVMGVPAHDERDYEFARRYSLPIKVVVLPQGKGADYRIKGSKLEFRLVNKWVEGAYTGGGVLVNSYKWNGWKVPGQMQKVIDWLERKKIGERKASYHLRDWLISRQRYWGPPIPMIYCKTCAQEGKSWFTTPEGKKYKEFKIDNRQLANKSPDSEFSIHNSMKGWYPVPEKNLPVKLPYIKNYQPKGTGASPLAQDKNFVNVKCPHCGAPARRETDVSDTFLDSSWYFLRYLATEFDDIPFPAPAFSSSRQNPRKKSRIGLRAKRWLPVHMYIGGAEHSVLHLLYVRFIWKALQDWGYIEKDRGDEPFPRFFAHGLIIKDGAKMSKSKGNVVVPDDYISKYGADALRCYLMFLGPFEKGGDFRDSGMEGMYRFIKRVWNLVTSEALIIQNKQESKEIYKQIHKTIKRVTKDIESLRFNRAIAGIMEYVNFLRKIADYRLKTERRVGSKKTEEGFKCAEWDQAIKTLLLLLAPFAPHMTEELWQNKLGQETSVHTTKWPEYQEKLAKEDIVEIPVQVNGKLRATLKISQNQARNQQSVESAARDNERILSYLKGKKVEKVVFVPGRLLNFVVV